MVQALLLLRFFDLELEKYIFPVKSLRHPGHESKINGKETTAFSEEKPHKMNMIRFVGVANTPLPAVASALHRDIPWIYFNKSLLKRESKRAGEE
eukprot:snap_masked-scaffold_5-processed-gene-1.51-mRNA-1 protein AED:1.00 eAED:1.00 QI:0/0/0/0/1/1/2/0/94